MMSFKIEGLKELLDKLEKNKNLEPVKGVVKKHGASLQSKSMRAVPVNTGTLKRSISLELTSGGMAAEVSPNTEYAQYVEYGTRFMTAQPYMRPSFYQVAPAFVRDLQKLVK